MVERFPVVAAFWLEPHVICTLPGFMERAYRASLQPAQHAPWSSLCPRGFCNGLSRELSFRAVGTRGDGKGLPPGTNPSLRSGYASVYIEVGSPSPCGLNHLSSSQILPGVELDRPSISKAVTPGHSHSREHGADS